MRSIRECPIDGCTAELKGPASLMCGGHWHRLDLHTRAQVHRAAVALERREQAADRNGWTARRIAAIEDATAELADAQREAIMEVERLEGVLQLT